MARSRLWELASSGLIQAMGSLASLLVIAYLAHVAGPEIQGEFSALKAEFEFFLAVCLVGAPQAVFYYLITRKIDELQSLTLIAFHALITLFVVGAWSMLFLHGSTTYFAATNNVAYFAAAVALAAMYSNCRALVLATYSTAIFSVVTALPALLMLAGVITVFSLINNGQYNVFINFATGVFLVTYAVAALLVLFLAFKIRDMGLRRVPVAKISAIFRFGVASWIPPIAQSGCVVFAYRWLGQNLALSEELGAFSTAMALVLASLVPLNMVIPIFFKWWTSARSDKRQKEANQILIGIFLCAAIGVSLIWLFEKEVVQILFGEEYIQFGGTYSLLSLAILPQAGLRVWGVYYSSSGRPGVIAGFEVMRFLIISSCILIIASGLNQMVLAWLLAEYLIFFLAGGYFIFFENRLTQT